MNTHMDLKPEDQPKSHWTDPNSEPEKKEETKGEGSETEPKKSEKENDNGDEKSTDENTDTGKDSDQNPDQNPDDKENTDKTAIQKDGVQKRIDELTKKRREAERLAAEKDAELEQLKKLIGNKTDDPEKSATPETSGRPREELFETYEEYEDALVDWKLDQREAKAKERAIQERQEAESRAKMSKVDVALAKGAEAHEDFEDVVRNPALKFTQGMVEAVVESEHAHDIMYYLGKNPAESERIAGLSILAAAREIGRIEAKFEKGNETGSDQKEAEQKRKTNAPEPIKPVKGGSGTVRKDPSKMTMKEYAAARDKGEI